MNTINLVAVRNLYRDYGPVQAVRGVSFDVARGEVLGLLGPNGAGKSTIMQIVGGVLAPSAGEVLISGLDLLDHPRRCKQLLGYLPERPPLYHDLTVDEYLRYSARLRGVERTRAAVSAVKQRCGLGRVGSRLIGNLSKGYQQRVGIAQAIVHAPPVVILDEPTVGLDPIQVREIRALIRELGGEHSVILSTHLLPEVQAVCDRVQILHEGRLVLNESLHKLRDGSGETALRVALQHPPPPHVMETMTGVTKVEPLSGETYRLYHHDLRELAQTIVARSVYEDWGLYEVSVERASLEEIFVRLTARDSETTLDRTCGSLAS